MNKKSEVSELGLQIALFKRQFGELIKTLDTKMTGKCRESVATDLLSKMPDTTAFEKRPDISVRSASPPKRASGAASSAS